MYAFTVLDLWRSRDDLEWPSFLSLCCGSFCSSGVGVAAVHLDQNCSDSKMMGGYTRGSEKLGPAAWKHGLGWANDYFVQAVEAAGRVIARPEMVGSLVAFVVHQSVPGYLVHNDHSAHSRG
jgi:hypothetical protein